ncbi:MAG: hypothetical protein ACOCXT_04920 [Candidatus Dojkabacteria bacterium]
MAHTQENIQARVEDVPSQRLSGTVVRIEGRTLYVDTPGGLKRVLVPEDFVIVEEEEEVSFSEIEVDDRVSFTRTEDGELVTMQVETDNFFDNEVLAFLVLTLILLTIGAAGAYFYMKRNKT